MFGFVCNMIACMANVVFGVAIMQDGGDPTTNFVCAMFSGILAVFFLARDA